MTAILPSEASVRQIMGAEEISETQDAPVDDDPVGEEMASHLS